MQNSGCHGNQKKKTLKSSSQKLHTGQISKIIWHKWSLGDPLPKCLSYFDWLKNMVARGVAFSLNSLYHSKNVVKETNLEFVVDFDYYQLFFFISETV